MGIKQIKMHECKCERCEHEWVTRSEEIPAVCPKCKSPYWNRPRKNNLNNNNKK